MIKIVNLKIKNFRGIKNFEHSFNQNLICLVGRGDVGKTTILDAISYVLSSSWNISFYDTDFYNCDVENNIEIEATLIDISEELIAENKYGFYIRGYDRTTQCISDTLEEGQEKALTIKLIVDKNLEPKWIVTTSRSQEDKNISAVDRAKLNCFLVSDYVDSHFSWNKGSPLYSLLISNSGHVDSNLMLDTIRDAKNKIDEEPFNCFDETMLKIKKYSELFGLNLSNPKTTIDFKDIVVKDGKMCLHENNVPLRLKGKGTKRLLSIAIQLQLTKNKGIALIDEIEQGLEPDRIKQVIRTLKNENMGQIFIATHSRDAIVELSVNDLVVVKNQAGKLTLNNLDFGNDKLQRVVRACPEAFFANKVIVCEGATEVGICRALDLYRKSKGLDLMAQRDCYYVDGAGDNFVERAIEIKEFKNVCVLKDSDKSDDEEKNRTLEGHNIDIFTYENGNNIEKQVLKDLPWEAVTELLEYTKEKQNKTDNSILQSLQAKNNSISEITNTPVVRENLAQVFKDKKWFKRIDYGEFLGQTIFEHFDEIDGTKLHNTLKSLLNWIDDNEL